MTAQRLGPGEGAREALRAGAYAYLRLIRLAAWQKSIQPRKAITFQLKIKKKKKALHRTGKKNESVYSNVNFLELFLMCTVFKVFIEFVIILHLFYVLLLGQEACDQILLAP